MPDLLDYLDWRGDLSFAADAWNEIDALVMANYCYNDFPGVAAPGVRRPLREAALVPDAEARPEGQHAAQKHVLLDRMAGTARFGGMTVCDFVNEVDMSRGIQFSAVTADCPDGSRFISFRGTDNSLVGWKEDLMMSFETPVPAQAAAVGYLERAAARAEGPLRLAGHSKGGNLAVYAAMNAPEAVQNRIAAVYSFDGPGLDERSMHSEGYARIRARIRSYVPQASIVGLLLAYHPEYTVVKSTGVGIMQHDTFTWQVRGAHFVELEQLDRGSEIMDQALHEWLRQCAPEQRRVFVNTLFDILQSTDATALSDMRRNVRANATAILEAARRVDPSSARMVWQMLGRFLQIGAGSLLELLGKKPDDPPTEPKNRP